MQSTPIDCPSWLEACMGYGERSTPWYGEGLQGFLTASVLLNALLLTLLLRREISSRTKGLFAPSSSESATRISVPAVPSTSSIIHSRTDVLII